MVVVFLTVVRIGIRIFTNVRNMLSAYLRLLDMIPSAHQQITEHPVEEPRLSERLILFQVLSNMFLSKSVSMMSRNAALRAYVPRAAVTRSFGVGDTFKKKVRWFCFCPTLCWQHPNPQRFWYGRNSSAIQCFTLGKSRRRSFHSRTRNQVSWKEESRNASWNGIRGGKGIHSKGRSSNGGGRSSTWKEWRFY